MKKEAICKQCAECCKYLTFHYPNDPVHNEWARARGLKVNQGSDTHIEYKLHHPCVQLHGKKCKLQSNKPAACIAFPTAMGLDALGLSDDKMLPKGCAFREEEK